MTSTTKRALKIAGLVIALLVMPAHLLGAGVAYLFCRSSLKRWFLAICGISVRLVLLGLGDHSWLDADSAHWLVQLLVGLFNFLLSIHLVSLLYWIFRDVFGKK